MDQSELDNLQALADATDNANGAPLVNDAGEILPPPPPPVDYLGEARMVVDLFSAFVIGFAPKAEALWDEAAKSRIALALGPVLQKYAFSVGTLPVELTLIIVAGPVLWASAGLVKAQMMAKEAITKTKESSKVPGSNLPIQRPAESPEILRSPQSALYPA